MYRADAGIKQTVQSRRRNKKNSKEQTKEPKRQYRVDTGCKQTVQRRRWTQKTVQSRIWNQTDSTEFTLESNKQ